MLLLRRLWTKHFNSQPHKEADQFQNIHPTTGTHFNSQPHKEADVRLYGVVCNNISISTHSLTRRLTRFKK